MTDPFHAPLYGFFQQLRSRGFELGMDSYSRLLQVLAAAGRMRGNREDFKAWLFRVCKILWYKPNQSLEVFEELFHLHWEVRYQEWAPSGGAPPKQDEPVPPPQPQTKAKKDTEEPEVLPPEEPTTENKQQQSTENQAEAPAVPRADQYIYLSPVEEAEGEFQLEQPPAPLRRAGQMPASQMAAQQFLFRGGYRPIGQRDLRLSWRYLRTDYTLRPGEEVDIEATIASFFRSGMFTPVYRPQKSYYAQLMLWIDHGGSMVAFEDFARQVQALAPLGKFGKLPAVAYFRNVPAGRVFESPAHQRAISFDTLASRFRHKKVNLLIISDAGAARGHYDEMRVFHTRRAMNRMRQFAHRIVWLNPMPAHRWWDSSAEAIARIPGCHMFEPTPYDLNRAVDVLRGKGRKENKLEHI